MKSLQRITIIFFYFVVCGLCFIACSDEDIQIETNTQISLPPTYWHLFSHTGINIKPAWRITRGSKDVTVAVIDNGFLPDSKAFVDCKNNYTHVDFFKKPTTSIHGALVSSVLSTCPNNSLGVIGVNDVSPLLWLESPGYYNSVVGLFAFAVGDKSCKGLINCTDLPSKPVDVINASFGFIERDYDYGTLMLLPAIEKINQKGSIIVAAAGNSSVNADISFPSSLAGVITVGSSTYAGVSARFSNWGETVDIIAPGQYVYSATDKAVWASGTSLSAPLVTGVVSLMKSVYKELNWKTANYFLQSTAIPMNCLEYCVGREGCIKDCCKKDAQICTAGRLDAGAAVAAARDAAIEGLPKVALVDADHYLVKLNYNPIRYKKGLSGTVTARNMGGVQGRYFVSWYSDDIEVSPQEFNLGAKGEAGDSIELTIKAKGLNPKGAYIHIRSPGSGNLTGFTDELTLYARSY